MRQKIYNILNKVYGVMLSVSLFAGFLPLFPFIVAIIIGGTAGENIAVFLYKQYYPWVIALGSLGILVGLVALYIGKIESLSTKSLKKKSEEPSPVPAENEAPEAPQKNVAPEAPEAPETEKDQEEK